MARPLTCCVGGLGEGGNNICNKGETNYVNFGMAVKIKRFRTLKHTIQCQEQQYNILQNAYRRWNWILIRSPIGGASPPPKSLVLPSVISLRKVFFQHDTYKHPL